MIRTKKDLLYYLECDRIALGKTAKNQIFLAMRFGNFRSVCESWTITAARAVYEDCITAIGIINCP